MSDFQYSISKPPIMLVQRREKFTCVECGKPGVGPPNSRVHPGRCRIAHTKKTALKNIAKRKERIAKSEAPVPQVEEAMLSL